MKMIYLLRHGKAESGSPMQGDKERELNVRGRREIRKTAKQFRQNGWSVQHLITSPALRAVETAEIFHKHLGIAEKVTKEDLLYTEDAMALFSYLRNLSDEYASVMLVGHNPTFTDLAEWLSSEFHQHIPTGGLVAILFRVSKWHDIQKGKGELFGTIFPKIKENKLRALDRIDHLSKEITQAIVPIFSQHSLPIGEVEKRLIQQYSEKLAKKILKKH